MAQPAHPEGLSMLGKRKIEAEILKEVYLTLKESHGEDVAKMTIAESVRRSAIEQASHCDFKYTYRKRLAAR